MPGPADAATRARMAVEGLAATTRARWLTLEQMETAITRAAPDVGAGVDRRALIAATVNALVDSGRVELPRTPTPWEDGVPRLPRWVARVADVRPAGRRVRRKHPWALELMWARGVPLTDGQFQALKAVQRWLVRPGADDPHASVRERSVDIFEDDKRLESLIGGPLFAPGRLSFELLDCSPSPPPLAVRELRGGSASHRRTDWLVVENASTFRTLAAHPEAVPEVSLLVFGAGAQAPAGLPGLLAEQGQSKPLRVLWFGDVDRDGLLFAIAAELALLGCGVPVVPHRGLYRALVQRGVTAASRAPALSAEAAAELASWLGDPSLERFAIDVLSRRRRAMQEQVGPRELRQLVRDGSD